MSSVHLPVEAGYGCLVLVASNGFAIANLTFTCKQKIIHPDEWGILGVKRLDFYPISNCADCTNNAPAVVETLVTASASIAPTVPIAPRRSEPHSLSCRLNFMQDRKLGKKVRSNGSNSNVGRYIYTDSGKGEFRLSFLKLIMRSLLPTTASSGRGERCIRYMAIALQRVPSSQLKSPHLDYSLFANVE